MKLTQTSQFLIKITILMIILGIVLANSIILYIMLIPLMLLLIGLNIDNVVNIDVKRTNESHSIRINGIFENNIEIEISGGIGIIVIADMLPDHFELVEGSNFKVVWKGIHNKKENLKYSIKCSVSGTYNINKLVWQAFHFMNLKQPTFGENNTEQIIEIIPYLLDIKKIRDRSTISVIPIPSGSNTAIGVPTPDFKELRLYAYGDPYRYINWKATARNISHGNYMPIVNEYEKEGKKNVWIFMDMSKSMQFGTNMINIFEYAIEASNSLSYFYLQQNCQVALCTFNGDDLFLYPASGKKQYYLIQKKLLQLSIVKKSKQGLTLKETTKKYRKYFAGSKPLCIIITRLTSQNAHYLSEGIREIFKYACLSHGHFSILVVNLSGYGIIAKTEYEKLAALILENRDVNLSRKMRKSIDWINWDPEKISFSKALISQVIKQ